MAQKGSKLSAETKAKMSAAHKARWEEIATLRSIQNSLNVDCAVGVGPKMLPINPMDFVRAFEEAEERRLIDKANPRCRQTRWQQFVAWLLRK